MGLTPDFPHRSKTTPCQETVGRAGTERRDAQGHNHYLSHDDVLLQKGLGTLADDRERREVQEPWLSLPHGRFWKPAGWACAMRAPRPSGRSPALTHFLTPCGARQHFAGAVQCQAEGLGSLAPSLFPVRVSTEHQCEPGSVLSAVLRRGPSHAFLVLMTERVVNLKTADKQHCLP